MPPHNNEQTLSLLAQILRTSSPKQGSPRQQALRLLQRCPTLHHILHCSSAALAQQTQLPHAKIIALQAALKLGRLIATKPLPRGQTFSCARQLWEAFGPQLQHLEQETFWILLLDQRNRFLQHRQVSLGSTHRCPVHPTDVFSFALRERARKVVLMHNHPSGDPQPSPEDRMLTKRLESIGKVVGIPILD
ncbi:MAG: JAB domain-containing protein, partial [Myxococcota bacterium]